MTNSLSSSTCNKTRAILLPIILLSCGTFSTLLFIMCFIHFLKNNYHKGPPIVSNELQDFSTTKSIYFLLSFYFFLWTILFLGLIILSAIQKKTEDDSQPPNGTSKGGKGAVAGVLLILTLITLLLISIDMYSPWINNFVQGKIFSYCVQVSGLITISVTILALLTLPFCSTRTNPTPTPLIIQHMLNKEMGEEGGRGVSKCSYANPCYNTIGSPLKSQELGVVGVTRV